MKKISFYVLMFFIATTLTYSFKTFAQDSNQITTKFESVVNYFESNGNFINSENAPAIISASEINENVDNPKYLVLDIRTASWFEYGHIKNAKNVEGSDLLNYFLTKIKPEDFDKITIVCYSGQSAAYYASLLRLYGFNNTYSLNWGMSSWAEENATNIWIKNSKSELASKLDKTETVMPEKGAYPELKCEKENAEDIIKERIKQAFAKPYKEFIVKTEDAFATPANYYIVNYVENEKHNFGHVPGAIHYQPNGSLSMSSNLLTLPTNKKVLVNCTTGQHAAYVVAYLHILGYDVANLAYGYNSYMNSTLLEKGWNGFDKKEIMNYKLIQ